MAGIGLLGARGFWSTYSWEHIAAQAGMMLFDSSWNLTLNTDAELKGLETLLALSRNAVEGVAGAGWGENRADWLGGQVAANISWQDLGTQAMRPDQSQIVDDFVTIYEPRIAGGVFAPPNIAGSTSVVTATSRNPEGAFLMLAFLTISSIMAMNEANGVASGYRSVLANEKLRAVSQPMKVWADSPDHAWCSPRLPGMFEMEQALGSEINRAITGQISAKEALDNGQAAWVSIMQKNGFKDGAPRWPMPMWHRAFMSAAAKPCRSGLMTPVAPSVRTKGVAQAAPSRPRRRSPFLRRLSPSAADPGHAVSVGDHALSGAGRDLPKPVRGKVPDLDAGRF